MKVFGSIAPGLFVSLAASSVLLGFSLCHAEKPEVSNSRGAGNATAVQFVDSNGKAPRPTFHSNGPRPSPPPLAPGGIRLPDTSPIGRAVRPAPPPLKSDQPRELDLTRLTPEEARVVILRNRGTDIRVQNGLDEQESAFQQQIVDELGRLDLRPPHRLAHFHWCSTWGVTPTGWRGRVLDVADKGHGWLVTVRINPFLLDDFGSHYSTYDYILETYFFEGGALRYLGGVDPVDSRQGQLTRW